MTTVTEGGNTPTQYPKDDGTLNTREAKIVLISTVAVLTLMAFGAVFVSLDVKGITHLTDLQALEWVATPILGGAVFSSALLALNMEYHDANEELHQLFRNPTQN